ncbi:MAG: DUF1987 domain-containing protein [Bacteroidia bacterium]
MDAIHIQGTEDTPTISFDSAQKTMTISGRSIPEDVRGFYQPVFQWLEQIRAVKLDTLTLEVKLEYFNTASSKILLDVFLSLEEYHETTGAAVKICWFAEEGDDDMSEAGEEYKDLVSVPFDIVLF